MKAIGQYTYRVGQAVAFLIDGAIRFGNVATVITKQDKEGERTAIQVNVRKVVPGEVETDGEPERFLIPRGELITDLGYAGHGSIVTLAKESSEYKAAIQFEDDLNKPKEEEPEVRQAPPAYEPPVQVDTAGMTPEAPAPASPPPDEDVPL